MSHWVNFYIFDPHAGAIVHERWLGQSGVVNALHEELHLTPNNIDLGENVWSNLKAAQMQKLAKFSYSGGPTPEEIIELSQNYPDHIYWWFICDRY